MNREKAMTFMKKSLRFLPDKVYLVQIFVQNREKFVWALLEILRLQQNMLEKVNL